MKQQQKNDFKGMYENTLLRTHLGKKHRGALKSRPKKKIVDRIKKNKNT